LRTPSHTPSPSPHAPCRQERIHKTWLAREHLQLALIGLRHEQQELREQHGAMKTAYDELLAAYKRLDIHNKRLEAKWKELRGVAVAGAPKEAMERLRVSSFF
jgi:hypothetical protein